MEKLSRHLSSIRPVGIVQELEQRCLLGYPYSVQRCTSLKRIHSLDLDIDAEVYSVHRGPISWLDVDKAEERFLLTGGADGRIGIYDLEGREEQTKKNTDVGYSSLLYQPVKSLHVINRLPSTLHGTPQAALMPGHFYGISCVQWYPVDSGIFLSAGMDGFIKVWDTNNFSVAMEFVLQGNAKALSCSISPRIGRHSLVAVGAFDRTAPLKLGDMRTGSLIHSLPGHQGAVLSVAWSPVDDYMLATGSEDQTARLWDIRRSGHSACLHSFDMDANGEVEEDGTKSGDHHLLYNWARRHAIASAQEPYRSGVKYGVNAHNACVNGVKFVPNGRAILTTGADNRLRIWSMSGDGRNVGTHFMGTKNCRRVPVGIAVAQFGRRPLDTVVIFPNEVTPAGEAHVLAFCAYSTDGLPFRTLRGHFGHVNCCAFREHTQEVVSGGQDGMVLLWSPTVLPQMSAATTGTREKGGGDAWSGDNEYTCESEAMDRQQFVPPILRS